MIINIKVIPLFTAALVLLSANIFSFFCPWIIAYISIDKGSYAIQSEADIGIVKCDSPYCETSPSCCSNFNGGNLFDFLFVYFPSLPEIEDSQISKFLIPFQYGAFPVLYLISISSLLCTYSIVSILFSLFFR